MSKAGRKASKKPKSTVKAAQSTRKLPTKKAEPRSATTSYTPVSDLCIHLRIEDEDVNFIDGSEPGVVAGTSSTEKVAPDPNRVECTICTTDTSQHELASSDSPRPEGRGNQSVQANGIQENWISQSAELGPGYDIFSGSDPFGHVATPSECRRRFLERPPPLRNLNHSGSPSTQVFPGQSVRRGSGYGIADQICPYSGSLPPQPLAPETDSVRFLTFTGSSSGLEGYPADYSSWQTEEHRNSQPGSSTYAANGDPIGYSNADSSGGLPLCTLDAWNPMAMMCSEALEDRHHNLSLRTLGGPRYQHSGMNNVPLGGIPDPANHSSYPTPFCAEYEFGRDQPQF